VTNEGPPQRVSPIRIAERYTLPLRAEAGEAQDAFRQSQFLLGGDLALFEEAMNLQLRIARDAYPSQHRTHRLASLISLWSRTYVYLADAALLTLRGSYPAALPLLRSACECIAAAEALRQTDSRSFIAWLGSTYRPDIELHATEVALRRFFSGQTIVDDAVLRSVYRPVSELARPSFGATALQVAPESSNVRFAIGFAESSFHLGWAEVCFGWLLALAARQVRLAVEAAPVLPIADEVRAAYESLQTRIAAASSQPDRCRIEEIEDEKERRLLVHNFRRSTATAPRKIVL
jgi:hypothetical protein